MPTPVLQTTLKAWEITNTLLSITMVFGRNLELINLGIFSASGGFIENYFLNMTCQKKNSPQICVYRKKVFPDQFILTEKMHKTSR
jgi:hypothetical protein